MNANILVIDDDDVLLKSLNKILRMKDYRVETTANSSTVESLLENHSYQCILLDVKMPGVSGLELLKSILTQYPLIPVIMISGHSDINTAVECIKKGAYDFIEKPIDPERLFIAVKNAIYNRNLKEENALMFAEIRNKFRMIGKSPAMTALFQKIEEVAETNAKVLILGESGTGKELAARAIHNNSERRGKPYIKLNCAAIPSELLESEIFGHRKGAFTGAVSDRKGKFAEADGGTLFLDEIGDMDLKLQTKLLRVLEENEVERIGDNRPRKVDVRVIAATNHNLESMVSEGKFREDLYYRLNVVKVVIPPLRERAEDILPLAEHFIAEFNDIHNRQVQSISRQASSLLMNYEWPGNVRELRNVMEKMVIFARKKELGIDDVLNAIEINSASPQFDSLSDTAELLPLKNANSNFEKNYILMALHKSNWKINQTAKALGIDRSNLFKKMRKHRIRK